ncbi:MEF2-activating motif and SAP domain-containing transcriptional regulator isoform X11 [Macaca fascicularis]|uniref:MEF2-activating motif and SAP domain-containing transcriptional regulator isoform X11 n=1 Tax=Macaca fascicularis TaxID=9541 RepID=UPI00075FE8E4|nr:PREDICTED: MEF2-activating motif and SAP domain-containing transcriptional regulator isoform X7 [Macaca fascicularis]
MGPLPCPLSVQVPIPALAMTLAASSQRSQIIRSKFRSVLQLRIHRRNQEQNPGVQAPSSQHSSLAPWPALPHPGAPLSTQPCSSRPGLLPAGLSGSFIVSPVSDPDPWISASGPPLAPALPSGTAPFLFSPGVLLPEPEYCPPWRSPKKPRGSKVGAALKPSTSYLLFQESPKISQRWRESKPRGNLTYHQYMPPEPRQGSRADPQAEGSALGPPGPPLWEGTDSQQPHPRMKPCVLTPCPPGVPSPSPPPHKLELQTLKLEELTVKPSAASHRPPLPRAVDTPGTAPAPTTTSAPAAAPALNPSSAPGSPALTLEEELQEAIRRAQLLPNRDIDDILEDQVEPDDPLPPIPLDFPGSFDVLSPSPDSEGLSSVFSSSLPSPTNSSSPSPRDPTDSLDWLEALSGGPPLGSGPPPPSIFSADLSDSSSSRLWDLLEDPW